MTDWAAVVEDSLRAHNEDLEKLVAEYMSKHQEAAEESNRHLQEGTAVRKELLTAQQDREMVKQDLDYTKKTAEDTEKKYLADIARLQAELESARQQAFDQLRAERERAAKELQELRDRMARELEAAGASASKSQNDRLNAERARHEMEMQQLRAEMESAAKRAEADRLALEKEISSLREQLDRVKKELAEALQRAELAEANTRR